MLKHECDTISLNYSNSYKGSFSWNITNASMNGHEEFLMFCENVAVHLAMAPTPHVTLRISQVD